MMWLQPSVRGGSHKPVPCILFAYFSRYMNMRHLFLILSIVMVLCLPACIDDDFTTSPHDTLTFSTDTVTFDTVFTDLGTPTARLLVFNHAKKAVNISSIRFLKGENSNFQLNVDGMSGKDFRDVEIRGGDSIYVFIECFIPEGSGNEPTFTEDQLEFITNGVSQRVQVEAYGQNVTRLRAVTLTENTVLTADRPYVVFDSLVVSEGTVLTVEPGTRLLFHDKACLTVRGRIHAVGAPGKMILMRGDRSDKVLTDLWYTDMSAQWTGMTIAPESFDNVMEYIDMRSTTTGLTVDSTGVTDRRKLLLRNAWLHNSAGNVLTSRYAWVDAYGVCFSEAAEAVVHLTGGRHTMVQCTFANNYLFAAPRKSIITLAGLTTEETEHPMVASFENSIVAGMGGPVTPGDLKDTEVYMRYVLFSSKGENDDHFMECLWDKDPLFLTDRPKYYFNYHVLEDSPALEAGNPAYITELCLIDMDGNNRMDAYAPTLGAYAVPVYPEEE